MFYINLIDSEPLRRNQFSSVQSLSHVRLFATPWIAASQASLFITISRSSLRLTFIESVMPSSHLILCRPLLLLRPIPPSIRVFFQWVHSSQRWPKYWSFSFRIIPSKEIPGLISLAQCFSLRHFSCSPRYIYLLWISHFLTTAYKALQYDLEASSCSTHICYHFFHCSLLWL